MCGICDRAMLLVVARSFDEVVLYASSAAPRQLLASYLKEIARRTRKPVTAPFSIVTS